MSLVFSIQRHESFILCYSAQRFKFIIAKYGIRRKYKCKYHFKCHVKGCESVFASIKDWNFHHKKKHSKVKYTCTKCKKVMDTPASYRDHVYTHNETQITCGRCNKSFPSVSRLNLHHHVHKRQRLYTFTMLHIIYLLLAMFLINLLYNDSPCRFSLFMHVHHPVGDVPTSVTQRS